MALIKCPECGKEISDKATTCPNCAYPFENNNHVLKELKRQSEYAMFCKKKKVFRVFLMFTIICSACLIIMFFWQIENSVEITAARASESVADITGDLSYQSVVEKKLVKIDSFVKIAEKILIAPTLIFAILSIYNYNSINKLKRKKF